MWHFINRRLTTAAISTLIAFPLLAWGQIADSHNRILELFQAAQEAEQSQDFSKSVAAYREIVKIDPGIAEVWSNMGVALFYFGSSREAIAAFQKASKLKPSLLAPYIFEGQAYLNLNEPREAIAPLKTAMTLSPNQPEAALALGNAYAQTHQFEASVDLLKEVLKRDPDSESIGSSLAVTYLEWAKEIGSTLRRSPTVYGKLLSNRVLAAVDAAAAEVAYRDTVAFAPGSVEAHLALANFLMENQPTAEKLQASEEQVEAARKLSPRDLDVAAAEIHLAGAQHDSSRVSLLLQSLMQQDPVFTLANLDGLLANLPADASSKLKEQMATMATSSKAAADSLSSRFAALELLKSKRPLSATEAAEYASAAWHLHKYQETLAELVGRHREDTASQYWLFNTCEALGRDVLEQTVNAHPNSVRSHLLMANFAVQQNNYLAAQSEYEAAMSLSPHDPEIILLHVRLLETMQEKEQALREASAGANDFPRNAGLNSEAGELMLRLNNNAEGAARYLEQALQSDSTLVRARTNLADAYAQLERFDDAIREVNRIIATDDDGALHYRQARWYRQTGHAEEAAKALELSKRIKEQRVEKERSVATERSGERARNE